MWFLSPFIIQHHCRPDGSWTRTIFILPVLRVISPCLFPSSLPLHAVCFIYLKFRALFFLSKLCKSCFPSSHSLPHVHPCSAVSFFQIIKKKKRKRWLNSSNPFLASHCLSVNQGESFLTFLLCCEDQMCSVDTRALYMVTCGQGPWAPAPPAWLRCSFNHSLAVWALTSCLPFLCLSFLSGKWKS